MSIDTPLDTLNVASEGSLMARILSHGPLPFLTFKLLIVGFAAYTLYRFAHLSLAKHGLTVGWGFILP